MDGDAQLTMAALVQFIYSPSLGSSATNLSAPWFTDTRLTSYTLDHN